MSIQQDFRTSIDAKLVALHLRPQHGTDGRESVSSHKELITTNNHPHQHQNQHSTQLNQPTGTIPSGHIHSSNAHEVTFNPLVNVATQLHNLQNFVVGATSTAAAGTPHLTPNTVVTTDTAQSHDAKSICQSYMEKYAVIPGQTWGSLPTELQK